MKNLLLPICILTLTLSQPCWALQGHDISFEFPVIPFYHEAIQYMERPPEDPVALLQKKMDAGEVELEYKPVWGYLPSLLEHLAVPIDSQILVFSRTSAQIDKISMSNPRAIYFNDNTSVAFVFGARALELSAMDPELGLVLYTLAVERAAEPKFNRQGMTCLKCHMTPATLNVPGPVVSTVYPTDSSSPYGRAGSYATDHRIPLKDRWGGWFVTGTHGGIRHRGNVPVDLVDPANASPPQESQNLTSLEGSINPEAYLVPTSDIVALMTLDHQTRMTNLITRISWETRIAIHEDKLEEYRTQLETNINELLPYMLFANEASLESPIQGISTFTETFSQRGPRDSQGRSLRDFDLENRLFRYPLSYMIYSPVFEQLPKLARERIYIRLYDVLTGADTGEDYEKLSKEDRRAVLEILRETQENLPGYWDGMADKP
jgi:hypothetical protein